MKILYHKTKFQTAKHHHNPKMHTPTKFGIAPLTGSAEVTWKLIYTKGVLPKKDCTMNQFGQEKLKIYNSTKLVDTLSINLEDMWHG